MGVPAFFRWLSRKYPSVIVHCVEKKAVDVNGTKIPTDSSEANPNGIEFDNLYLDMNGIIHPCTHPEDRPAPKNEDEMMVAIFDCIDRLFNIVRPRKVLYMAIDGVAPRAKMNQQRSRRFRASKETAEKINEIKRIRAELLIKGCVLPPEKPKEEHFDSNCITPGTPFMARLSECLHYYIHDRLNNDPGWKSIKVILSDANVPGEGEHKIMDYIRRQRAQPDHDANTQHVLCGADADLIMLGLATHEPNFTIIREEFKPNQPRPCEICGQLGHEMKDCIGGARSEHGQEPNVPVSGETDFIFVRLNVLREYLERELLMPNLPFKYEFDRVLDDWVFMCFFVGNDFLPHLPSLEIRENAIDRLIRLYKDCVYKTGGYLTDSGDVKLERVQMIMLELGKAEDEIFKTRQQKELSFKAREKAKKRRSDGFNEYKPNFALLNSTQFAPRHWKSTLEKETFASFIKIRGNTKNAYYTKIDYKCHRSGVYKVTGKNIRHLKTQGSNKIGGFCPAKISVIIKNNKCVVTFCRNHVGHQQQKDLGHLFLSKNERENIAAKIAAKIPLQVILDEIRDSISNCHLERLHLLTKKDLYNIESSFQLNCTSVRHQNDAVSVDAWVNELKLRDSVLFYKPQDSLTEFPYLKPDDFILIIMTEGQKELALNFGDDCICVDGTHGLNGYGFELHTILVLDDLREGYPCAFLISNRSDREVLKLFFSKVEEAIQKKIRPRVFMSDMAEAYYNAWLDVMHPAEFRLYCSWHVDKAWRKNLDKIRNDVDKKAVGHSSVVANARQEAFNIRKAGMHSDAKTALESMFKREGDTSAPDSQQGQKRKHDNDPDESEDDQAHDEVRLWEDGFKDRYYESKFDVGSNNLEFRYSVALHYVRGLCWVLKYYYQGCASWKWYYPYHYAPFASDFCNIDGLSTEFESDTKPFNPLEQLMGVFPAASSKHVPEPWAKLMSDPESTIIDFYPEDFKIDLNGKKFAWQGVALLPFVDEERLFKALEPYYGELSDAERKRNIRGDDRLYVSTKNEGYDLLSGLYQQKIDETSECAIAVQGMRGTVLLSDDCVGMDGGSLSSPVKGLPMIYGNVVVCVRFRDPKYSKGFIFPARKLKGATDPLRVLKPEDLNPQANRNWRSQVGMAPATQRANINPAGHRMVNHYTPRNDNRQYANIPPPFNLDNSRRGNYGEGRGGYNQRSYDNRGGYQDQRNYSNQSYNQGGGSSGSNYQRGGSYQQQGGHNRNQGNSDDQRRPGPYNDRYVTGNANRYSYRR